MIAGLVPAGALLWLPQSPNSMLAHTSVHQRSKHLTDPVDDRTGDQVSRACSVRSVTYCGLAYKNFDIFPPNCAGRGSERRTLRSGAARVVFLLCDDGDGYTQLTAE